MRKFGWLVLVVLSVSLIIIACEKHRLESEPNNFSFPIGRSFLSSGEVKVKIGERDYVPNIISDFSGGYWLTIPQKDITNGEIIKIQFIRKKENLALFTEKSNQVKRWTSPSYYIDCDNEMIKNMANILTSVYSSNIDKAKSIQQYLCNNFKYNNDRKYSFFKKASQTYLEKQGTCMNASRLFVALCRAANVPARSIWGIVSGTFHHQWAEILDDSGKWHPTDFTFTKYFDLNDIRYLDLIYGAEENDFIIHRDTTEIMFHNLKYYNDYPTTVSGNTGFKLMLNYLPDSMTTEYIYEPKKLIFY